MEQQWLLPGGGGDSSGLDANYLPPTNHWPEAPSRGGGVWEGLLLGCWVWQGRLGEGGSRRGNLGGGLVGRYMPPRPSVGQSQAPLTSPCPPSNRTITLNLTLTFAASWFGHASHVD